MNNTDLLSLQEVVWEITGQCNNHCDYCGSKDVWRCDNPSKETILAIAASITEASPKEVSISGGDPLLIDVETHSLIINMIKQTVNKVKILTNPKSWKSDRKDIDDILSLYDGIGISLNEQKEIDLFNSNKLCTIGTHIVPITFITNVSTDNIFLLGQIEKIINEYTGSMWMIQYTMFKESDNKKAVYNNDLAFNTLEDYINKLLLKYPNRILLSDNMVNNKCYAGTHVCGITYDGHVIPCLSMRSWIDNIINNVSQGQITNTMSLKEIWQNKFHDYRFKSFKCCKDHCNNKCMGKYVLNKKPFVIPKPIYPNDPEPFFPGTIVYAMITHPKYPIVTMYMVRTGDLSDIQYTVTTLSNINNNKEKL